MKTIDFTQTFIGLKGTPILDGEEPEKGEKDERLPLTLATVCCNSLLGTYRDEPNLQGTEKMKRFSLAMKINAAPGVSLTAEDVTELKTLIGKAYVALIVGQAWLMLDPPEGDE